MSHAPALQVFEETGFDIRPLANENDFVEITLKEKVGGLIDQRCPSLYAA